ILRRIPSHQRRHFSTVWIMDTVAMPFTWFVVWSVLPPERLDLLFLVYPLWIIQVGMSYFAFASEAGGFYISGAVFFVLAVLVPFVLPWAPLLVGLIMCCNMTTHALFLRRGSGLHVFHTEDP